MKKIIFFFVICLILIPTGVSARQPGIPEPPPATSCNDYQIIVPPNSWAKNAQNYLINSVGIHTNASVPPSQQYGTLSVAYRFIYTAPIALFARTDTHQYRNVSVYEVMDITNIPVCTAQTFSGKYYALVTNNKVFDIVYLPQDCNELQGLYTFTDQNGKLLQPPCLNQARKDKIQEELNRDPTGPTAWFRRYLISTIDGTRAGMPIGTVPGGADDCGAQFKTLVDEIAQLRRLTYYFATNGCEEATAEKPCETDLNKRNHVLFRPKGTGESIPDTMIAYQQALREMIQMDGGGVLAALAKTYEIESLIFTDEGIQRMQEIGNLSISMTNRVKTLESKCNTYINDPSHYCVSIPKYNPDPNLKEKICNWKDLKAIADKAIKLGQLVGQNPTTTQPGPLSGEGWITKAINTIKCWLRNMFIVVFQYEANAMGWILRRNY